jgi:hypothetical protein
MAPIISTLGSGSARGFGLGRRPLIPFNLDDASVVFTSRADTITEGDTSNFANITASNEATWGYSGDNTDAITITTSVEAGLLGFSINNRESGSSSHGGNLYVISGNTTGGNIIAQKSFSVFLPQNTSQTIIEFDDPVILPSGTYTCAMAWPNPISSTRTYRFDTAARNTSTVTVGGRTLNVSYATTSDFSGSGALGDSNGTEHTAQGRGQIVTFKWLV